MIPDVNPRDEKKLNKPMAAWGVLFNAVKDLEPQLIKWTQLAEIWGVDQRSAEMGKRSAMHRAIQELAKHDRVARIDQHGLVLE